MTNNRDYKEFAPGSYYHVYNRGNGKMDIFCDKQDYEFFLIRLIENLEGTISKGKMGTYTRKTMPVGSFHVVAYCLMPNHFHLLLRQNTDIPISKLMSKISTSFSKYFNLKYERVGSLFQDQFKSVVVNSDAQLRWLVEYIHQNPVKAKMVNKAEDYPYSSCKNIMMVPIINRDFILEDKCNDENDFDFTSIAIDEL